MKLTITVHNVMQLSCDHDLKKYIGLFLKHFGYEAQVTVKNLKKADEVGKKELNNGPRWSLAYELAEQYYQHMEEVALKVDYMAHKRGNYSAQERIVKLWDGVEKYYIDIFGNAKPFDCSANLALIEKTAEFALKMERISKRISN